MSPKLVWSSRDGRFKSAVPMTAMTFAALIKSYAPDHRKGRVKVVNDRCIEIDGELGFVVIHGEEPK